MTHAFLSIDFQQNHRMVYVFSHTHLLKSRLDKIMLDSSLGGGYIIALQEQKEAMYEYLY